MVPYSMLTATDGVGLPVAKPPEIRYSPFAGVDNLILEAMGYIYTDLSPENLCCDGELPYTQVAAKSRELNRKLQGLFQAYGRSVSEEEVYAWERQRKAHHNTK